MKSFFFLICYCFCTMTVWAQNQGPNKQYVLQSTHNAVQYKNYYLLTLLQQDQGVKKLVQNDPVMRDLFKAREAKIKEALKSCQNNIACFTAAFRFTEDDIAAVSNRLSFLFKENNVLGAIVRSQVIPSGCYSMYGNLKPVDILLKAWEQDAKAINFTIGVYVEGSKPNYPKIDSIGFNVKDKSYPELVNTNALLSLNTKNKLFFEPSMQFALVALEINERNDAADYEPMMSTVNKSSLLAIKKTNFGAYKYSLILVPGEGPEERDTELSAGGMLRCRLAAEEYRIGVAPFIMVSGGRVHPYKTKYSEAHEMKKFLIQSLQIPESAIIMEPHARHTTTNMRNAARIMFRYGMPMDKKALTVTVKSQSMYISDVMPKRCIKELGYEPYRMGNRLSDTMLEFYPNVMSLQIDYDEPMDP
ncbi:YdcF family protein [Pedobacter hiemivivus]|uniref:YdcF family protein n=1 Tax=Pedobacter hiemivivus TaxID=2530454 RepID=A0A4U1GHB2_9SPHI|nr:YdcF family protein [Pedobacter hiemivivus]TKC62330.1 YdcF family protein [Pedobacter hiemivivus]